MFWNLQITSFRNVIYRLFQMDEILEKVTSNIIQGRTEGFERTSSLSVLGKPENKETEKDLQDQGNLQHCI